MRSFLIPAAVLVLVGLSALINAGMSGRALTLALVVGLALVVLAALVLGGGASLVGLVAVAAGAAVLLVVVLWSSSPGEAGGAFFVGLSAWVVLPAVAGLFHPRPVRFNGADTS